MLRENENAQQRPYGTLEFAEGEFADADSAQWTMFAVPKRLIDEGAVWRVRNTVGAIIAQGTFTQDIFGSEPAKPRKSVCKHCGGEICKSSGSPTWRHHIGGAPACPMTAATPRD